MISGDQKCAIRAFSITMRSPHRISISHCVISCCLAGLFLGACVSPSSDDGSGGAPGSGSGGRGSSSGGTTATGGTKGTGGVPPTGSGGKEASSGGTTATGGVSATGGRSASGGAIGSSGGVVGSGGRVTTSGGTTGASGGVLGSSGGVVGSGGRAGSSPPGGGGTKGSGGVTGSGGTSGSAGTPGSVDLNCDAAVPSGGTVHQSSNASGTTSGLAWTIWSNGSGGSITTYSTPAFSAAWNNSMDFLARMGLQWNNTKTYDQYGTISAQFAEKRSGSGGGYSYIGVYGWSTNPCVEFYIVDDSFNTMPVNPGNTTNKGTVDIDGGSYILYTRSTSGTGGSKCSGVNTWDQFYSVRKTARKCGTITISDHFKAWAAAGMTLGKMDQAQILIEVGGGNGSIDFTTANVTTSQ